MDPMLWISVVSGIAFAFLGNWMARRRGAHTIIWTGLGFLFPPSLLILKVWRWEAKPTEQNTEAKPPDENGDDEEDEDLT